MTTGASIITREQLGDRAEFARRLAILERRRDDLCDLMDRGTGPQAVGVGEDAAARQQRIERTSAIEPKTVTQATA